MTLGVYAAAVGTLQAGFRSKPAVAIASSVPAGNGGHNPGHGIDAADRMVLRIHDDHVVLMVAPDGLGCAPGGREGRAAVAAVTPLAGTGEGGHDAAGIHFPNAVAFSLADVGVPLAIHADCPGAHDGSLRRGFPIPGPTLLAIAGEGRHDAGLQIETAYPLILNIRDEQAAFTVQETIVRLPQLGQDPGAAVAAVARLARASHRGDDARGGFDFTDGGVQPVDDVDIAVGVDLERIQVIQGRRGCRAAVAGVALTPAARDGHDDARALADAADGVVAPVANVEVALRVEVAAVCFADQRLSRRAATACVAFLSRSDDRLDLANLERHARFPPSEPTQNADGAYTGIIAR